ncbi:protein G12-like [Periplaneta americana]|uniref:protein G12-like n=1 Tax=Periplaneta americana TaxID=6978 RepID=UPI0037E736FA
MARQGYINEIHSVLGWDPYVPPSQRKHARRGVGVDGLIDDIIAILPVDDLKALFQEKPETSPDFKAFYDADLLRKLRDKAVDIYHYIELIRALFGLTRAERNLQDDLNDFLALIPTDQILAIAMDYLANDAEVQELVLSSRVAYLQSDDFHKIINTIEALPEFANFYNFLKDHVLDVVDYINENHSIIGLPPFVPPSRRHARRGVGINGLIDDVIAILPVDELKALFPEKMETSPDFKALYDAIRSPEFQVRFLNS